MEKKRFTEVKEIPRDQIIVDAGPITPEPPSAPEIVIPVKAAAEKAIVEEKRKRAPKPKPTKEELHHKDHIVPAQKEPGKEKFSAGALKKATEKKIEEVTPQMSEEKVIETGLKIERMRRMASQIMDEGIEDKRRLSPTPENLIRWAKNPGKFDLIGVDTFERTDPTANYKSLIAKQKQFNVFKIKA